MQKIQNVEFLRFIMIIDILLYHLFNKDSLLLQIAPNSEVYNFLGRTIGYSGQTCVDFFFIIAGFFLLITLNKSNTVIQFLQKKVIRLLPVVAFMYICYWLLALTGVMKFDYYSNLLALFLINSVGITLKHGNITGTWFVSVLVSVLTFYFYILKHFEKKFTDLFIILFTIIGYAFLVHFGNGRIGGHIHSVAYIFNIGIIRGLSGIGCGIVLGNLYNMYRDSILNYKEKWLSFWLFSAAEIYVFAFLVNNLTFHRLSYKNDIILIIFFIMLFALFVLKRGLLSKLLDCKFSVELGKYAYSIFLTHLFVVRIINYYFWKSHIYFVEQYPVFQIILAVVLAVFFGVLTYHFVEKPAANYLKNLFNNNSVKKTSGGGALLASYCLI